MKRRSLMFCIIAILLFSGVAFSYVQEDRKETSTETVTGTVISLSGSRVGVETTVNRAVKIIKTFMVTDETVIRGTVAVGKTVVVTFRREGFNGRFARFVAVIIQVLE